MFRNARNKPTFQAVGPFNPAAYELGSLESRAAARAMLDGRQQPKFQVTKTTLGQPLRLATSACTRAFWPDSTVFELVNLDGEDHESDRSVIDRIIAKIPIDGKEHTFAEMRETIAMLRGDSR